MTIEIRAPRTEEFGAVGDMWEVFMTEQNELFINRISVTPQNRARFLQFVNEKASAGNILVVVSPPEDGGGLIGYATFDSVPFAMELEYQEAAVLDLYIHRDHRGRGYGRRLMEAALEEIRRSGFVFVRLQVYANNDPAIGFYEHLGFSRYIDVMKLDL
jgi:ribosomal protein S18 acetylase RimI-like enzyme